MGALACTLWVAAWVAFMVYAEGFHTYHANDVIWHMGNTNVLYMSAIGKLSLLGFSPVVPMTLGAALMTLLASLLTPPPSQATINRYFPARDRLSGGINMSSAPVQV